MAIESVLITGGMGLIGSNLAGQLAANGYNVTVLGRSARLAVPDAVPANVADKVKIVAGDDSDPEILEELVKNSDAIFHKASSVGMSGAVESARDYVGENLYGTATLVDVLKKSGTRVKKVVLGSSMSVYGEGNYECVKCGIVRPVLRFQYHQSSVPDNWDPPCPNCGRSVKPALTAEGADRNGESVYAVTRKTQEDLLTGCCRLLGIPLSVLRYSTVLGPGQSWHNPFTRVLEMLAMGESPSLNEDGRQTREFIFINDLIDANVLALNTQDQLIDQFNISAIHKPLIEFMELLSTSMAQSLGTKPVEPIVTQKLVPGDVRHCWSDCSKAENLLRFKPRVETEAGIKELINWFVRFKGMEPKAASAKP